jgi:hypothetical protein
MGLPWREGQHQHAFARHNARFKSAFGNGHAVGFGLREMRTNFERTALKVEGRASLRIAGRIAWSDQA